MVIIAKNLLIMLNNLPEMCQSGTVTNKIYKEIPKERYIFPEERKKIMDELRLK